MKVLTINTVYLKGLSQVPQRAALHCIAKLRLRNKAHNDHRRVHRRTMRHYMVRASVLKEAQALHLVQRRTTPPHYIVKPSLPSSTRHKGHRQVPLPSIAKTSPPSIANVLKAPHLVQTTRRMLYPIGRAELRNNKAHKGWLHPVQLSTLHSIVKASLPNRVRRNLRQARRSTLHSIAKPHHLINNKLHKEGPHHLVDRSRAHSPVKATLSYRRPKDLRPVRPRTPDHLIVKVNLSDKVRRNILLPRHKTPNLIVKASLSCTMRKGRRPVRPNTFHPIVKAHLHKKLRKGLHLVVERRKALVIFKPALSNNRRSTMQKGVHPPAQGVYKAKAWPQIS